MNAEAAKREVSPTIELAVRRELICLLFGSPAVPLINGLAVILTAGMLWRIFPRWASLCWLLVSLCVVLIRIVLWSKFNKHRHEIVDIDRWARLFTITTAIVGCLWGFVALTTRVAPQSIYYFFAAFVVGGLSAGAAIRNSPHPPAFYVFIGTSASPMIAGLFMTHDLISIAMGVLLVVFIAVMILVGRENHQRLHDYIRMKIEQEVLIDELQKVTLDLTAQIAEKEKIALALEESGQRFRAIGDNALDAIIISDSAGKIVYWNPAAERMFGFTAEESEGQSLHRILTPLRDQQQAHDRYISFADTGLGKSLGTTRRVKAIRKDGTEFSVDLSVSAMLLDGSQHALGIVRDVSEQEAAMQAQAERQVELEEAQRLAHIGNWSYDPQSGVTTWSDELFRIFGCDSTLPPPSPAEYEGLLTAESFVHLTRSIQGCIESQLSFEIDLELKVPNAAAEWVSMRGRARNGEAGGVHLRGTCQDITARKGAEALAREQESMFRSLVEQNLSGILIISEDKSVTYLNPAALQLLGFPHECEVIGSPVLEMVSDQDKTRAETAMNALISGSEREAELAVVVRRIDGKPIDVLAKAAIMTFKGRRAIITVLVDITERRRAEEEIVKLNHQMADTLAVLRRRECDLTLTARLSDMLQSCRTIAEAHAIIGDLAGMLFPGTSGFLATLNEESRDLQQVSAWGPNLVGSLPRFQRSDCYALQTDREYESTGLEVLRPCQHIGAGRGKPALCLPLNVQGTTRGLVSLVLEEGHAFDEATRQALHSFADVVKLSLANLELRDSLAEQALRDPLTGLFNRRYLMEILPREIGRAQRHGSPLTVAMLDIDHFKRFNDLYGHDAGDLVLVELAVQFAGALRADDVACRYGGEEFLFLLPGCHLAAAYQRMIEISRNVRSRSTVFCGKALPGATLSIGLAALSDQLSTSESLITAADKALYVAKRMGRDRIEYFEGSISLEQSRPITENSED